MKEETEPRRRMSYANVTSTLALVIAIGCGTAYAGSLITGSQIADGTITAINIKTHSLLAANFKAGQLPAGATGPSGGAVAYGTVEILGGIDPTFVGGGHGFTGVSMPKAGVWCITPVFAGLPIIAAPVGTGVSAIAISYTTTSMCPNAYEVVTSHIGPGQGFNVVVP